MSSLRLLAVLALVLPLSGCELMQTADVATRYVAKMTCSCVYVVERPLAACLGDLPADASRAKVRQVEGANRIEAKILWIKAHAVYEEGRGCKLID